MPDTATPPLPPALAQIAEEFAELEPSQRLQLLVEFGDEVREVPEPYASDVGRMERVVECQSPVYVATDVTPGSAGRTRAVVHIVAPPEAPTTRGFAGVLSEGLAELSAEEIVDVPSDLPRLLGLDTLVSPLRVAGMAALLGRVQRQVRAALSPTAQSS